jgi:hypothetical protein
MGLRRFERRQLLLFKKTNGTAWVVILTAATVIARERRWKRRNQIRHGMSDSIWRSQGFSARLVRARHAGSSQKDRTAEGCAPAHFSTHLSLSLGGGRRRFANSTRAYWPQGHQDDHPTCSPNPGAQNRCRRSVRRIPNGARKGRSEEDFRLAPDSRRRISRSRRLPPPHVDLIS